MPDSVTQIDPGGAHLGRFRLLRVIGSGGMGVVYEALDPELGRRVAVKLMLDDKRRPEAVQRLRREAELAAGLAHPGIVSVHEVGAGLAPQTGHPCHYIVMDLINGSTLEDAVSEMSLERRIEVLLRIAEAVGHAHSRGVIHRDLKPANVLIDEAHRVLVADFGVARPMEGSSLTQSGEIVGTPRYMSPEQVLGKGSLIGPYTDVWSLGVMLYELLTGQLPFDAMTAAALYNEILTAEPAPPRSIDSSIPRDLETICLACLEKQQGRRYADGQALADDLARWRTGDSIIANPPSLLVRYRRRLAAHPWIVVLLILLMALPLVGVLRRRRSDRQQKLQQLAQRQRESARISASASAAQQKKLAQGLRYRQIQQTLAPLIKEIEMIRRMLYRPEVDLAARLEGLRQLIGRIKALALKQDLGDHPVRWRLLGEAQFFAGQPVAAEKCLLRSVKLGGAPSEVAATLGQIYIHRSMIALLDHNLQSDEKRSAISQVWRSRARGWFLQQSLHGESLEADLMKALRLFSEKKKAEAILHIRRALKRHGDALGTEELWLVLAWCMKSSGKGMEFCSRAIERCPNHPWAHFFRAMSRPGVQIEEIEADYTLALAVYPQLIPALVNRAGVRFARGNLAGAIEDCTQALKLDDRLVHAYNIRGRARATTLRDPEGALADFRRAIKIAPEFSTAYMNRGRLFFKLGRIKEAFSDFDKGIALSPGDLEFLRMRGGHHLGQKNYKLALQDFERIVELAPTSPGAYMGRAAVRIASGDATGGLADARTSTRLDPKLWQGWVLQAKVLLGQGKKLEAAKALRKAVPYAPLKIAERFKPVIKQLEKK